jgi:hypothetical protein
MRKNYKLLFSASTLYMRYKLMVDNAVRDKRLKLFLILKLLVILKSNTFQEYTKLRELEDIQEMNEIFDYQKYNIPFEIKDKETRKLMRLKAKHDIKEKKKNGGIEMDEKNREMNNLFRQAAGINTNEENNQNDNNNKESQNNDDKNKNKNPKDYNKFMNEQIRKAVDGKHGLVDKNYVNKSFSVDMDAIDEMVKKAIDKEIGGK